MSETHLLTNLVTREQLIQCRSNLFTKNQIEWLLRNRKTNGLQDEGAVHKIGKRIYIDESKFVDWFFKHRE